MKCAYVRNRWEGGPKRKALPTRLRRCPVADLPCRHQSQFPRETRLPDPARQAAGTGSHLHRRTSGSSPSAQGRSPYQPGINRPGGCRTDLQFETERGSACRISDPGRRPIAPRVLSRISVRRRSILDGQALARNPSCRKSPTGSRPPRRSSETTHVHGYWRQRPSHRHRVRSQALKEQSACPYVTTAPAKVEPNFGSRGWTVPRSAVGGNRTSVRAARHRPSRSI